MYARYLRRAAAVVMMTVVTIWGCSDSVDVGGMDPPSAPIPDRVEETSRLRASLYDPWNPFTVTTVDRLLRRLDVEAAVTAFENRGMEISPGDCVVIEGDGPDGSTRVTFIGMEPPGTPGPLGVVACFERGDHIVVAPGLLSATAPRGGPRGRELAPGVWTQSLPPGAPERWSPDQWDRFWDCLLVHATGPVTTCMVGCVFAGPGYMHCVLTCSMTQALSAVVRCAASVTLSGINSGKDQNVE